MRVKGDVMERPASFTLNGLRFEHGFLHQVRTSKTAPRQVRSKEMPALRRHAEQQTFRPGRQSTVDQMRSH